MSLPSLSIVIVNYNTADLLPACLDSIREQRQEWEQVIVVDNASADDSVAMVQERYPWVKLIVNRKNLGFGVANNLAVPHCESDLVFLLNPDTTLSPGCLAAARRFMAAHERVGLGGVQMYDSTGALQQTAEAEYPGAHYSNGTLDGLPGRTAWVLGAGMVVRSGVMEQVGGFDEDFFLYGEDIDLCLRIRLAGWEIATIMGAGITHLEGQSERGVEPLVVFEKKLQAEMLFLRKHYSSKLCGKIGRVRALQAGWRIFCLTCLPPLPGQKHLQRTKLARYRYAFTAYRDLAGPEAGQ